MDNNPFRNQQSTGGNNYENSLGGGQQQQNQLQYQYQQQPQQQQQQPFNQYQPQQQQQQQQPQAQQVSGYQTGYSNNNGYGISSGVQSTYQPTTMGTTMGGGAATGGPLSPVQQQNQWQQQSSAYQFTPQQTPSSDLFNTQYPSNNNSLMSPTIGAGYTTTQQAFTSMPTPYNNNQFQQQQQQPLYGQNQYMQPQQDNSNFYIPQNFGMNTTTTITQQQGPKHAPVDASTLLKGTQVRRVECPICKKTIEGDDMAINHHVNQHL